MTHEEAVTFLNRLYNECLNAKNLALVDELIAPDYIDHTAGQPEPMGRDAFKQFLAMWFHAFPDFQFTIDNIIVEGDLAAWREHWTGTQTGELMGIPPTGKRVTLDANGMGRIRNGQAVEHWDGTDLLGLMQQLGVIPPLGAPVAAH